jgi:hypothetical protein
MLDVVVPATETIDSMGLLVVRVLASRPSMPRRAAVNITAVNILHPSPARRQRSGNFLPPGGQVPGVVQSLLRAGVANALTSLASTHSFSCGRHRTSLRTPAPICMR